MLAFLINLIIRRSLHLCTMVPDSLQYLPVITSTTYPTQKSATDVETVRQLQMKSHKTVNNTKFEVSKLLHQMKVCNLHQQNSWASQSPFCLWWWPTFQKFIYGDQMWFQHCCLLRKCTWSTANGAEHCLAPDYCHPHSDSQRKGWFFLLIQIDQSKQYPWDSTR